MKILCWNINSLLPTVRNAEFKFGSWLDFLKSLDLDVLCLQETKLTQDKLTAEISILKGYESFWACSQSKKGYSGVCTYVSSVYSPISAEADSLGNEGDLNSEGRTLILDLDSFVLINVYVPNAGQGSEGSARLDFKFRYLRQLRLKMDGLVASGREVMVVGDFNISAAEGDVHPKIGLKNRYTIDEIAWLKDALSEGFVDIWRYMHPETQGVYTCWDEKTSARAFNEGVRIDYVLTTPGLVGKIVSCEILSAETLPPKWSDHAGILLQLRDIPPVCEHPSCPLWTTLKNKFRDPTQRTLLSMLAGKRPPSSSDKSCKKSKNGNN